MKKKTLQTGKVLAGTAVLTAALLSPASISTSGGQLYLMHTANVQAEEEGDLIVDDSGEENVQQAPASDSGSGEVMTVEDSGNVDTFVADSDTSDAGNSEDVLMTTDANGTTANAEGDSSSGSSDALLVEDDDNEALNGTVEDGIQTAEEAAQQVVQQEEERQESEAAEDEALLQKQLLEEASFNPEAASQDSLIGYLNELTSRESPTGSDGELLTGRYIESVMTELGYQVEEQSFHEGFLNEDMVDVPGVNIIAERGADSLTPTNGILVLCAHYDSVTDPEPGDELANDKSGVAVLLETARLIADIRSDIDICFLFLSGEEDGYYGSEAFMSRLGEDYSDSIQNVIYVGTVGMYDHAPYYLGTVDGERCMAGEYLTMSQAISQILEEDAMGELTSAMSTFSDSVDGTAGDTSQDASSEAFAQSAQENSADGQQTDSKEYSDEDRLWTYAACPDSAITHFEEGGISAVLLYQQPEEEKNSETESVEPETSEDATAENAAAENATAENATAGSASAETEEIQTEEAKETEGLNSQEESEEPDEDQKTAQIAARLAKITDILVRAAGIYMQGNL